MVGGLYIHALWVRIHQMKQQLYLHVHQTWSSITDTTWSVNVSMCCFDLTTAWKIQCIYIEVQLHTWDCYFSVLQGHLDWMWNLNLSLIVTLDSSIESEILNVVRMTRIPSIAITKLTSVNMFNFWFTIWFACGFTGYCWRICINNCLNLLTD